MTTPLPALARPEKINHFPAQKTCKGCGLASDHPARDFSPSTQTRNGVIHAYPHSRCKACKAAAERVYRKGTADYDQPRCPGCATPRTAENVHLFPRQTWRTKSGVKTGPGSLCLSCHRERNRRRRQDPEQRRYESLQRRLRYRRNREADKEKSRAYHEQNRARILPARKKMRHVERLEVRAGIVLTVVGSYYDIHPSDFRTAPWNTLAGEARAICCRLLHSWAHISDDAIGDILGLDRTTAIHHWQRLGPKKGRQEERAVIRECSAILREASAALGISHKKKAKGQTMAA